MRAIDCFGYSRIPFTIDGFILSPLPLRLD
jgi:hypothetical protein